MTRYTKTSDACSGQGIVNGDVTCWERVHLFYREGFWRSELCSCWEPGPREGNRKRRFVKPVKSCRFCTYRFNSQNCAFVCDIDLFGVLTSKHSAIVCLYSINWLVFRRPRTIATKRLLGSSCLSILLSAFEELGFHWTDFHEFDIQEFFSKICR
jgi:hypothetical protein